MASKYIHITKSLFANFCRFVLAIVFLFSAVSKGIDPHGSEYKIGDYLVSFGLDGWYPDGFPLLLGMVLTAVEFYMGLCLLFGMNRRISTWMSLLFMCVMTPLTLYIALANPVSDCGCFGDVLVLTNWETFAKNVVLFILAVALVKWNRYRVFRLIGKNTQWMILVYGLLFIFTLQIYSLYNMPIADFTSYKIGTNIPEGMSIPEGAEEPEYESTFILEKDGVKKEFTLDNYPDSTWTFLETKTSLVKAGYIPPIHDFVLQDVETGDDVTEDFLAREGYSFLLVAYNLTSAEQGSFDQINEIFDYCREKGYGFHALTASGEEEIERWKFETGAEYPFWNADGIMLKTLVRSNPGLVLIKNGTILNKWSRNNLPTEILSGNLEDFPIDKTGESQTTKIWSTMLMTLVLPLLLITLLDRVWAGIKLIGVIRRKTRIANLLKEKKK